MLEFFDHGIIKSVVSGFGTLFNDIHLVRYDDTTAEVSRIKVPLSYGPKQKFIVRLEQKGTGDISNPVEMILPRMAFELTNISYDADRKLGSTRRVANATSSTATYRDRLERVPYILSFDFNIMTKNTTEGFQIVEQILPYFGPDFSLTFKDFPVDNKLDVPITIGSVVFNEEYTGDFETRKVFIATLGFTAKIHLYGPVRSSPVILQTITNFVDLDSYSVTGATTSVSGYDVAQYAITGGTFATVTLTVTGGATAGNIGATGTIDTNIREYL